MGRAQRNPSSSQAAIDGLTAWPSAAASDRLPQDRLELFRGRLAWIAQIDLVMWSGKRHPVRRHDLVVKPGERRAFIVIAADMQRLQASPFVQGFKAQRDRRLPKLVPRSCQG